AIADIDRDGRPDIMVANSGANTFSVFHNTIEDVGSISSTSFKAKIDFTVGGQPQAIVVADIDGDSAFDVLTANATTHNISVLRNRATKGAVTSASFAPKVDFIGSGSMVGIVTGDINGDGKQDILAVTKDENTLSYYMSNAVKDTITNSTYNGYTSIPLNASPSFVGVTDMNGDGMPDVVVLNSAKDSLSVHQNYNGFINTGVKYYVGNTPVSASLGDITGDGKADIVIVNGGSNSIAVLGSNLVNSAPVITSFSPGSGAPGTLVTIVGKNFDQQPQNNIVYFGATRAEVVTAYSSAIIVNVPAGATYQPISVFNVYKDLAGYSSRPFVITYTSKAPGVDPKVDINVGKNPVAVTLADITGDGKPDLLVSNAGDNNVSIYKNIVTGKGALNSTSFAAGAKFSTGVAPASIAVGDFNLDGINDMVVANYNGGTISVLNGSSDPANLFFSKVDYPAGKNPSSVAVHDINGDGKPDIIVSNAGGSTVSVFRNTIGDKKSFADKFDIQTGANPASVGIADMNNDGWDDIYIGNDFVAHLLSHFPLFEVLAKVFFDLVHRAAGYFFKRFLTAILAHESPNLVIQQSIYFLVIDNDTILFSLHYQGLQGQDLLHDKTFCIWRYRFIPALPVLDVVVDIRLQNNLIAYDSDDFISNNRALGQGNSRNHDGEKSYSSLFHNRSAK
ncbi:MAG: hypothetical protein EOP51_25425, partial [Sphingobacteriales bacterium]